MAAHTKYQILLGSPSFWLSMNMHAKNANVN